MKTTQSNYSYFSWLPSRQTLAKTGIALTGVASTALLGLAYLGSANTNDSVHYNLCAAPAADSSASALANVAYGGLQTAAALTIPVFQGMGLLGRLGLAAHVDRQQEKINLPATKVIHIPQYHIRPEMEDNPFALEAVWESQFRVLQQLLLHPTAAVFQESLTKVLHHSNSDEFLEEVTSLFSDGLPKEMALWSEEQRTFLAYFGAARTLHYLGKIESIYPTIDPTTNKEINLIAEPALSAGVSPCDDSIRELLFERREEALAKEVREFSKKPENKDREIVIVFGRAHDLSDEFAAFDFVRLNNEPSAKDVSSCRSVKTAN